MARRMHENGAIRFASPTITEVENERSALALWAGDGFAHDSVGRGPGAAKKPTGCRSIPQRLDAKEARIFAGNPGWNHHGGFRQDRSECAGHEWTFQDRSLRSDPHPGYKTQLEVFATANEEIIRQADEDNVEGAALAFTQLTISCVNCHKQLRKIEKDRAKRP